MTTVVRRALAGVAAALLVACSSGGDDAEDAADAADSTTTTAAPVPEVRLNEVQVLGSHNSYHLAPDDAVLAGVAAFNPALAAELDYDHRPITEQLEDFGIRQLEIDVYPDPDGGRFANRPALQLVGLPTASGEPLLDQPGFKVLHLVDVDFRSTCVTFVACLEQIEAWSASNAEDLPVMVMIEAKTDSLAATAAAAGIDLSGLGVQFTDVLPWTRELFDDLEAEILSVFDREQLIVPDDVRGTHDTLEQAVLAGDAWPTLADARGRVLFALVDTNATRDTYVGDATALEDRLLFTSSQEGRPDAAFLRIDDAVAEGDRLTAAVRAGYLVRTRSDVPPIHAVQGDTSLRDAALASGAQYVSTDYYVEDPELGTGFVVQMPDGPGSVTGARCNPVNARADCTLDPG
jgi:hypothetical protein